MVFLVTGGSRGIGRGIVAKRSIVRATAETLAIAASAAAAGVLVGRLLS